MYSVNYKKVSLETCQQVHQLEQYLINKFDENKSEYTSTYNKILIRIGISRTENGKDCLFLQST